MGGPVAQGADAHPGARRRKGYKREADRATAKMENEYCAESLKAATTRGLSGGERRMREGRGLPRPGARRRTSCTREGNLRA